MQVHFTSEGFAEGGADFLRRLLGLNFLVYTYKADTGWDDPIEGEIISVSDDEIVLRTEQGAEYGAPLDSLRRIVYT